MLISSLHLLPRFLFCLEFLAKVSNCSRTRF
uniref:Uncharacterized protein n=1 Tax=Setaria viridis TaxID=4556 RepID=A0A4V6D5K4_SETVI|nr:hypothetical protein SEVIR_6G184933v2 [Setaria viridis]